MGAGGTVRIVLLECHGGLPSMYFPDVLFGPLHTPTTDVPLYSLLLLYSISGT